MYPAPTWKGVRLPSVNTFICVGVGEGFFVHASYVYGIVFVSENAFFSVAY